MINITVKDLDGRLHEVRCREGESLMEALRLQEWGVAAACGGMCSCGTCHVYIDPAWLGKLQPPDSDEQDLLDEFEGLKDNSRLSCQVPLQKSHEGIRLTIAPEE